MPLGSKSQNSYCAMGHPPAFTVTVTVVPAEVAVAGDADALIDVHGTLASV